jgi:hypothetical protein
VIRRALNELEDKDSHGKAPHEGAIECPSGAMFHENMSSSSSLLVVVRLSTAEYEDDDETILEEM